MNKTLGIGIVIGATLSGSFTSTIGGARQKFNTLGHAIKNIGDQRGLIERVEKDQAALEKARLNLGKTQKKVAELKLALRKNPEDEGTAKALEQTQAKAVKLGAALEKQKTQLRQSEVALGKVGIAAKDASAQYARLGDALDKTRAKQERLKKVMERKDAAGDRLSDMKGQALGVAGAAYGAGRVLGQTMDTEHELRLFGNVADLTNTQLLKIKGNLNDISDETNQAPGSLLEALNTLTAKGLDPGRALASLPIIGKAAKGANADINDLATTSFALIDAMKISPEELPRAMDILAQSAGEGAFELKNMAQYFPMLTAQARSLNMVGMEGIATLGSALQIAMKGAADPGTAANNFQNFLAKLTAPETVKRFDEMGINLEESMKTAMAAGKNPIEEMVLLIKRLTGGDKFRIGELFGDMQVINFLNPMLDDLKEFDRIKKTSLGAKGVVDADFAAIMGTAKEQTGDLVREVVQLGDAFASVFLPSVGSVVLPLTKMVDSAGELVTKYPVIGKVIGAVAVGVGTFATGIGVVTGATWLWNASLLAIAANPVGLAIAGLAAGAALIINYWDPISGFFKNVWEETKTVFMEGVAFLTNIWEMSPIGMMFKAGQALAGWIGESSFGGPEAALAGAGGAHLMTKNFQLPPPASSFGQDNRQYQYSTVVHAAPGMNPEDVAKAVDRKLTERESQAAARQRGVLYD